ncbi:MAG: hypothetical protein ACTHLO_19705, partial [Pseudolabrys sp.]
LQRQRAAPRRELPLLRRQLGIQVFAPGGNARGFSFRDLVKFIVPRELHIVSIVTPHSRSDCG